MNWMDQLKENILSINVLEEQKMEKIYNFKKPKQIKQLRASYFIRPKIISDWEYKKQKQNINKPIKEIRVKQFSNNEDYNKPWNKLKYEFKINRIIHYVKSNDIDNETKKLLIQSTKNRKIKVDYEDGEIKNILNLESLK